MHGNMYVKFFYGSTWMVSLHWDTWSKSINL